MTSTMVRSFRAATIAVAALGAIGAIVSAPTNAEAARSVSPFAGDYWQGPWGGWRVSIADTGSLKGSNQYQVIGDEQGGSSFTVTQKLTGTVSDGGAMSCRGTVSWGSGSNTKFAFSAVVTSDAYGTISGTVTEGTGPFPTGRTFVWSRLP